MKPNELYREGKLREAIKALGEELRSNPTDAKRRTFLFELLLFTGDYDRAEKHLDILAGSNKDAAAGALLYRSAIHAERTRQKIFAAKEFPSGDGSLTLPTTHAGHWDDGEFDEISDADPRIGAHLEVFIAGSYTWIPFRYLRRLEVERPTTLRDLIWARARVEATPDFRLQELGEVLVPVLSPLSFQHADESVQLGRETAWEVEGADLEIPYGGKVWVIDGVDVPLLKIRSIEWRRDDGGTDDDGGPERSAAEEGSQDSEGSKHVAS